MNIHRKLYSTQCAGYWGWIWLDGEGNDQNLFRTIPTYFWRKENVRMEAGRSRIDPGPFRYYMCTTVAPNYKHCCLSLDECTDNVWRSFRSLYVHV